MLEPINYDERQFDTYAQGRELSSHTIDVWMQAFARRVRRHRPLSVLDLGSGTGRFTPALAQTFGGPVYGVEPAERMRLIAEESARHPRVTYLDGAAEQIPLPDKSCDVVIMYLSFHHIRDRQVAAQEIARVLRPSTGGQVLVRSSFAERIPDLLWHRYFPRARAIEEEMFPTVDQVASIFAAVGLQQTALDQVRHRFASSMTEYAAQLHMRAISTFEHLTEDEITAGFAALAVDVQAEVRPQPVEAACDLLVFTGPS